MGFADTADRAGVLASMHNVLTFQALFFRHFAPPLSNRFGAGGDEAVSVALRRYGHWRGERMAQRHLAAGIPRHAASLVRYWDFGDWHSFGELGAGAATGTPRRATVTIESTPMWDDWAAHDQRALARPYYAAVYAGIAAGYGAEVEIPSVGPDLESPWSVTWTTDDGVDGSEQDLHGHILTDLPAAIQVLRWTSQHNAALYYFIADETTKRFDMAGEAVVRESVRALARERAAAQKARHVAQGWPLDLVTLQNHWDGDFLSLWKFAEGLLTPGTWHQNCIECPYFETWRQFGRRGMELGYLYDYELHPTLYREYHPDCVVQFAAIKTRGDATCNFRVSIPTLQSPGEPAFEGYQGCDI